MLLVVEKYGKCRKYKEEEKNKSLITTYQWWELGLFC